MVELDNYQRRAVETAIYPGKGEIFGLLYTALGLGEAGEVQGKVKKVLRDDEGKLSDEKTREIADELGDVLWYVANCAEELGYTLSEIATMNLFKLQGRKNRGTLTGSGDKR